MKTVLVVLACFTASFMFGSENPFSEATRIQRPTFQNSNLSPVLAKQNAKTGEISFFEAKGVSQGDIARLEKATSQEKESFTKKVLNQVLVASNEIQATRVSESNPGAFSSNPEKPEAAYYYYYYGYRPVWFYYTPVYTVYYSWNVYYTGYYYYWLW